METKKTKILFERFDELCIILNNLKASNRLSLIEKDLALEKLRELYNIISHDIIIDTSINFEKEKQERNLVKVSSEKENIIDNETFKNQDGDKNPENEIMVTTHKTEKILENTGKVEKNIISDKYQGSVEFMNEHISKQHPASDLSVKVQSRPIDDIGKAIGLNDKFLYINELFKGDSGIYKKTLDKINNSADFNAAFSFLNDQFNWNMKSETVQKFMELVRRKFISREK